MKFLRNAAGSILIVLLISNAAFAQISFSKGVKAGLNVSTLRIDDTGSADIQTKNGIVAGGFLGLDLLGPLNFQAEALFTQKGAKQEEKDAGGTTVTTLSVNYLEIPVFAKISTPVAPPLVTANFYAGPAFAVKISEDISAELNGTEVPVEGDLATEDVFKSSDVGAVAGANLSFSALGLASLIVDLRYTLGLSHIAKNVESGENSVKNGVVTLSVGLGF